MFDLANFDAIQIGLASPEKIREWSHGEVKKPETINYRTLKPERDGLFCERIFGPTKDWECHCGRYKRVRYKGVVCEKCGVEVTRAKVRRERMGHIELAAPVSHIWHFKGIPCRMKMLLDMSPRNLERVLYFVAFVVTDPGNTPLQYKQMLTEVEYREAQREYGAKNFKAGMGAEAIKELLMQLDLEKTAKELREEVEASSGQKRANAIKRLEVIESFLKSGNKPEWIILDVLPVIPPEIRPMVQLDGGRFATSDLNDLYRRVINRNNRLKRLLELNAPDIIVRNEKRMLQEAVDALIDNGRRGRPVTGPGNRPLKSLSDMLRGKQGRFRQNLLGKRVDYSGRSVIVVGPELKMYQCGLPKEMALELFKPFVMKELNERKLAHNIKSAKRMVERVKPEVWDVLEDVIRDHPVLLNRAPTLHRLGIQAFEPVLVEGRAIKLHPLVCTAYNADFDGDQMAVHVPLSVEAQAEARFLMLAANNILKPQDGKPVISPSQDMVMGCYYLTMRSDELYDPEIRTTLRAILKNDEFVDSYITDDIIHRIYALRDAEAAEMLVEKARAEVKEFDEEDLRNYLNDPRLVRILNGEGRAFSSEDEAMMAYQTGKLSLHALVKIRIEREFEGQKYRKIMNTSIGRIIFNHGIPQDLGYVKRETADDMFTLEVDKLVVKNDLANIIDHCYRKHGPTMTSEVADSIKAMGYKYSTRGGVTVGFQDITVPEKKRDYLAQADEKCGEIDNLYRIGLLSKEGRRKSVIEVWKETEALVTGALMKRLSPINPIFMMATSGARGSTNQIRQLAGMRGLMADPSGQIIEVPIRANFREGLSVLEFFISSHGARKGLADTALRTADSGYLTRRLVDVSHNVIIREEDCFEERGMSIDGMMIEAIGDGDRPLEPLADRILGRYTAEDVFDPKTRRLIVGKNEMITYDICDKIIAAGIKGVRCRTVFTCRSEHGVCAKCYGRNCATGQEVTIGEAVGIIAAQAIGEPGTQLTMRTFHTGGVASAEDITQGLPRVEEIFEARKPKGLAVITEIGGTVEINTDGKKTEATVSNSDGECEKYLIPFGSKSKVKSGDTVEPGDTLTEGSVNPHDILKIKGIKGVQEYMLREVQAVYRSQGVAIADKHIEVIIRQMLRKVRVEQSGDSDMLPGETVDIFKFEQTNEDIVARGGVPASAKRILLGITKASLATDSFLSAASFQETTKVLTEAAIKGKIDPLVGLKENVIIGKLIPAGIGMKRYRNVQVEPKQVEEPAYEETEQVSE
ncbi:MAG: DNA-directed RNA polymerase subunit beta' [Clostridia bacterium]|nr:DNA-directed RNA polymerase subunit beta' [Clostridia bacterium]